MKTFIFLYPIPEYINPEIENYRFLFKEEDTFHNKYKTALNRCINTRYRQRGYEIYYAIFDGHEVSNVIELQPSDKIIEVGIDFKTHGTKKPDGEYHYPDQDFILNQLGNISMIRIAGFHLWDCVEKLAKRAYERGLDTLIDEDLTELFSSKILDDDFRIDEFPGFNSREKFGEHDFNFFVTFRKNKPWM